MDKFLSFDKRIQGYLNKYYNIRLLRGILLFFGISIFWIFLVSTLEHFVWFSSPVRKVIFGFTILFYLYIFTYYFVLPLLARFGFSRRFSIYFVNNLLLNSYPEIGDKIINIYELKNSNASNNQLVNTSIYQKIDELQLYDFNKSLSFSSLKDLYFYVAFVSLFVVSIALLFPNIVQKSTARILHPNKIYLQDNKYSFFIDTSLLFVEKGNNYDLLITSNSILPESNIKIKIGNEEFLANQINDSLYSIEFKNVNNTFSFQVYFQNELVGLYKLRVLDFPVLIDYKLNVIYPEYVSSINLILDNAGSLIVPRGTILSWRFKTNATDSVIFNDNNSSQFLFLNTKKDFFEYSLECDSSFVYSIRGSNSNFIKLFVPENDITVINDRYPEITFTAIVDELDPSLVYFSGIIKDDYGFSSLHFYVDNVYRSSLPVNKNISEQQFFYSFQLDKDLSKQVELYFNVSDNDLQNGFKTTKSSSFYFVLPSSDELIAESKNLDKEVYDKMEESLFLAKSLNADIKQLKLDLVNKNFSDFEKKQFVNDIISKQQQLEELMNDLANNFSLSQNKIKNADLLSEEFLAKQEMMQELLENVLDDELKDLMNQLDELQSNFNENLFDRSTEKMEFKFEEIENSVDRQLELLKKYEIEKELFLQDSRLKNLVEEHNNFNLDEFSKKILADTLINNNRVLQNELKNELGTYDSLYRNNSLLEKPFNLEKMQKDFSQLIDTLDYSFENISNSSHKNKVKEKNQIGEMLEKLSDNYSNMLKSSMAKQNTEDAIALRQVLDNCLYFSLEEESILLEVQNINVNDPNFITSWNNQNILSNTFSIISDSLQSIGARNPIVSNSVNLNRIKIIEYLNSIDSNFEERRIGAISRNQQFVIKYTNDLILLLAEAIQNMDNAQGSSGSSSQKKSKRKQKPSLGEMRTNQQSFKDQLKGLINSFENSGSLSDKQKEQIGKSLMQQDMFQQMLNDLLQSGVGSETKQILNEINSIVEKNKRDLANFNLSRELINRQNNIVTRLLEAENAEQERELDKERKAELAKEYLIKYPDKIFDEENENSIFNDYIFYKKLKFNPFYQQKTQEYLKDLNN